jgi:hypothetical protein
MRTIYLKFPDEQTAKSVLEGFIDEEGRWITASHRHAIDPIGTLYAPTGKMLEGAEGGEYPELAPIDGWHANFIGELPEAALPYIIEPSNPKRRFA